MLMIKNKVVSLMNLYKEKCYVHNIFITNSKWWVVIGCYW